MTGPVSGDRAREEIAAALMGPLEGLWDPADMAELAGELLPVLDRLAEERGREMAAQELRSAANGLAYAPAAKAQWLRDLADALAPDPAGGAVMARTRPEWPDAAANGVQLQGDT